MARCLLAIVLSSTACGAEMVPASREDAPALALVSAVVDEDAEETTRRWVHEPYVDCRRIAETGYRRGKRFAITVVTIDGNPVEERTANAYWAMRKAAADAGVDLVIYSGFRTHEEQQYFYDCYRTCSCNGCSPAAKPGRSNHQSGYALDLAMSPGAHDWLVANGDRFGFVATVAREPWHWEYRPGKRVPKFAALCPEEPKASPRARR